MALPKEDASVETLSDITSKFVSSIPAPAPKAQATIKEEIRQEDPVVVKEEAAPIQPKEEAKEAPKEREVEWTTKDGQVRKIKIAPDATVESLARKAREYEDGMRKFQQERDELTKRYGKETDDMVGKFKALEKALKHQGIEGVIDALAGREGAAAEYKKQIADRAVKRLDASEIELARMDGEEILLAERRMREAKEAELSEIRAEKEAAELASRNTLITSRMETAFSKVRLEGKFNDSEFEEYHNQIIWDKAQAAIEKLAEAKGIQYYELTPQAIHAEVKRVADLHTRGLQRKAEEVASQKIEEKKQKALETAQNIASKGVTAQKKSVEELVDEAYSKGNGMGAFSSLFKQLYGNK